MKLDFVKDLSKVDVYAIGDELATVMGKDKDKNGNRVYSYNQDKEEKVISFPSPVLVTDNYQISQLNPVLRDTVFSLYSRSFKRIVYDGVSLDFDANKYLGVWSPSIDTLFFCRGLNKVDFSNVKKVIEIGSGSGYISKYVLEKHSNLEKATSIDLNRYAMDCAQDNIDDSRFSFYVGDAIGFLEGKKYDMILCNPPYIPRNSSIDDNPYEGLNLVAYLIKNNSSLLNKGGQLVINISSVGWDIIEKLMTENNINYKLLDEIEVPLKVFNVLNNKDWLNYLIKRGLKKEYRDGYNYWHTLKLLVIEN